MTLKSRIVSRRISNLSFSRPLSRFVLRISRLVSSRQKYVSTHLAGNAKLEILGFGALILSKKVENGKNKQNVASSTFRLATLRLKYQFLVSILGETRRDSRLVPPRLEILRYRKSRFILEMGNFRLSKYVST